MNLQLQRLRKERGFKKQGDFAQELGIPPRRYASWERQEVGISLDQACMLADALSCTLDELAGRKMPSREPSHDGLRADERRLLASYGALDGEGRGRAVDYVDYLATRHAAGEGGLPERLAS